MNAPILLNHDYAKPIGFVEFANGALHVRFTTDMRITKGMAFEIFDKAGLPHEGPRFETLDVTRILDPDQIAAIGAEMIDASATFRRRGQP